MEIIDLLFYKKDNLTGEKRIGKTKTISILLFILVFVGFLDINLNNPTFSNISLGVAIMTSVIAGLLFVVPIAIIGWLFGKFLEADKQKIPNYQERYDQSIYANNHQSFNQNNDFNNQQMYNQSTSFHNNLQNDYNSNQPNFQNISNNNAEEFKNAIINNNGKLASELLFNWDNNDANYLYAKIIFDGMPPSDVTLVDLNNWLDTADKMNAYDNSLKSWYRDTAIEVINLNK